MGFRNQLVSLLSDGPGSMSANRYVYIFGSTITIFFVVVVWAVLSVSKDAMQDIPLGVLGLVTMILGIGTAGKLIQKSQEKEPCDEPPPEVPK